VGTYGLKLMPEALTRIPLYAPMPPMNGVRFPISFNTRLPSVSKIDSLGLPGLLPASAKH
jgi:hypothetical protein